MSYSKQVLDHFHNPRNAGKLDSNDSNVGTGLAGNPDHGDVMRLQILVDEDGLIIDAKFKTFGCGSAIASSSYTTVWVIGKTIEEALELKNTDIVEALSLPPIKIHCSVLAEEAIKKSVRDYKLKNNLNKSRLAFN